MRATYDPTAGAAYVYLREIGPGEAVESVTIWRPGNDTVVLDFAADGTLLGVELIGARTLAPAELLAGAELLAKPEKSDSSGPTTT